MKTRKAFTTVILAVLLALVFQGVGAAAAFPEVIPLPNGFQPEGIALGYGHTFYAGSLRTGQIFRGDLRTGEGTVLGEPLGGPTVGLDFDRRSGYLFGAGGPAGVGRVFDGETGEVVAVFTFTDAAGTFINDVIVTRDAAYFTNSFRPEFYRVPLGPGGEIAGGFETIALGGEWEQGAAFGANGIVATPDGKWLLIVNSGTGILYRVDPETGYATAVDLGGYLLTTGDGLALRGHTLFVVRNRMNLVAVVKLDPGFTSGTVVDELTSPYYDIPTTAAVFGNALYAVNARFGVADPHLQEYDVVRVEIK